VDRFAIAQALNDIATLLALQGGARFKVIAYRRAARSLESTPVDLAELVDEQRLTELEHVGEAIARTIAELWHTGRSALRERLASELPPGSLELARVPGLTLKRIAKLHAALGVSTLSEVRAACERHAVRDVPGFGPRTESRILEGIQTFLTRSTRVILSEALAAANTIEAYLRACPELADASLAGQARRRCETVDELVFVALPRSGPTAADLVEHFRRYPAFAATEREPPAGRLASGLRVELRVTSPSRLAGDLFVATGSEAHVQRVLEALPGLEGWSSESDLYAAAGLAFIAPELRENLGEIASARAAKLPALVSDEDLRGFVHCHTRYSDGRNTIEEMARSAERAGMSYVTITDHSPSAHYAGGVTIAHGPRGDDRAPGARDASSALQDLGTRAGTPAAAAAARRVRRGARARRDRRLARGDRDQRRSAPARSRTALGPGRPRARDPLRDLVRRALHPRSSGDALRRDDGAPCWAHRGGRAQHAGAGSIRGRGAAELNAKRATPGEFGAILDEKRHG